MGSRSLPFGLVLAAGALAYFGLAIIAASTTILHAPIPALLPAAGLGVALVQRFGARAAISILLGALAAHLALGDWAWAVPLAIGRTLEGLAGGLILRKLATRSSDAPLLMPLLAAALAALIAPLFNVSAFVAMQLVTGPVPAIELVVARWLASALGVLLVAPAVSSLWPGLPTRAEIRAEIFHFAGIVAAVIGTLLVVRIGEHSGAVFLAFPVVAVAGVWLGARGSAWITLALSLGLIIQAVAGIGPFVDRTLVDTILDTQFFLVTLAVTALLFVDLRSLPQGTPLLVLLAGGVMGASAFMLEHARTDAQTDLRFQRLVESGTDAIRDRLEIYGSVLRGGGAFFFASEEVQVDEWRAFTANLAMVERYPGILGFGAIVPVSSNDLGAFIARQRLNGRPNFALRTVPNVANPRQPGDEHYIIQYTEPVETNGASVGLDVASEKGRKTAAEAARDTGQPTLSDKIILVADRARRPGFLLFVPMYDTPGIPASVAERRAQFSGWTYAPFVAEDFVDAALAPLGDQLAVEVYVGETVGPKHLLTSTLHHFTYVEPAYEHRVTKLTLAGHLFTVHWQTGPGFVPESGRTSVIYGCIAIVLATMLAALIANLQSVRARANAIASEMTTALAVSNDRLTAAISVMEDGFGLFDADDRIIVFNEAFLDEGTRKVFGNDIIGRRFEEIVRAFAYNAMPVSDPNFDREAWIAERMERHRNPPIQPIEVHWSGNRWMRISERRTASGGYIGIWTDITEIKLAQQRLLTAIDAMDSGFALFDTGDRLVIRNKKFTDGNIERNFNGDPTGRTFEEIIRAFAYDEVTAAEVGPDPEAWIRWRVDRHRNPAPEPFDQQTTDGRWVRISEGRTADGGYLGTWTDITALKQAEARLREAIDSIEEGFALFDAEMRYVIVNDKYRAMYPVSGHLANPGNKLEDAIRHGALNGEYPGIATPEEAEAFVQLWMSIFTGGQGFTDEGEMSDGRWLLISHQPTGSGGYVSVRTDITAQKRREAELQSAKDDLEARSSELLDITKELDIARRAADRANLGKSQFLANMAHELRTPLNAINGFSELILSERFGPIQPPKYHKYLEFIHQGGVHLLSLINDVLDLSKVEAGKMELHIEAVPTEQVAYQAMESLRKLADERKVTLSSDLDSDCPILHADARAVKQILLNLLSNAVKFTPPEGIVTLGFRQLNGTGINISVADNGVGMSEDESRRALEPYGQIETDLTVKNHGTGLGLPLVKSLAELHGGAFSLRSEKGVGTTVTVFLPWQSNLPRNLG